MVHFSSFYEPLNRGTALDKEQDKVNLYQVFIEKHTWFNYIIKIYDENILSISDLKNKTKQKHTSSAI